MTQIEDDIRRDEAERNDLQGVISEVETAKTVSTAGTRGILENVLSGARARVAALDRRIHDAELKQAEEKRSEAANVALAQNEVALSAKEKETYSGFLKEDYFTKRDFGKLEEFYTHTWDRLTDRGKDEMSKRIWNGVRRDEYKFGDLPKDVQEKEEKQAFRLLSQPPGRAQEALRIPEADRDDFLRAYESGNHQEAAKVLERDSFKQNLFPAGSSKPVTSAAATVGKDAESGKISAGVKDGATARQDAPSKPATDSIGNIDLAGIKLTGMKPASDPSQGAVANLPQPPANAGRGC